MSVAWSRLEIAVKAVLVVLLSSVAGLFVARRLQGDRGSATASTVEKQNGTPALSYVFGVFMIGIVVFFRMGQTKKSENLSLESRAKSFVEETFQSGASKVFVDPWDIEFSNPKTKRAFKKFYKGLSFFPRGFFADPTFQLPRYSDEKKTLNHVLRDLAEVRKQLSDNEELRDALRKGKKTFLRTYFKGGRAVFRPAGRTFVSKLEKMYPGKPLDEALNAFVSLYGLNAQVNFFAREEHAFRALEEMHENNGNQLTEYMINGAKSKRLAKGR